MRQLFTLLVLSLSLQVQAITATKEYVDKATNATLTASKSYTNMAIEQGGSTNRYALFVIPLNPDSTTPTFSSFELKGTTNNFDKTAADEGMVFYNASVYNDTDTVIDEVIMDNCRIYALGYGVYPGDVRKWVRIKNTDVESIGTFKIRSVVVLIDVAKLKRSSDTSWCRSTNDDLVWSYVRFTSTSAEMDVDNIHQAWRAIMPIKWYNTIPSWADQSY